MPLQIIYIVFSEQAARMKKMQEDEKRKKADFRKKVSSSIHPSIEK